MFEYKLLWDLAAWISGEDCVHSNKEKAKKLVVQAVVKRHDVFCNWGKSVTNVKNNKVFL
uniref:Uncharacterized protein n=1 Tax=Glossina pallidipes TaxID=7398 RepID=A0A1A9ZE92_GLOPL